MHYFFHREIKKQGKCCHFFGRLPKHFSFISLSTLTHVYVRFENWVLEARQPLIGLKGAGVNQSSSSRGTEDKSMFMAWLQQTLSQYRKPSSTGSTYNWEYEIFSLNHEKVKVCKIMFAAVLGISYAQLEWAQRRINSNKPAEAYLLKSSESGHKPKLTLSEALNDFGIDCDEEYRKFVDLFVHIEKIPETDEAVACVAFLVDFFYLCGDHEVGFHC